VADLKKDVAEFKEATKADVADLKKKFNWGIGVFIISQALIWFQLSKLSKLSK
jgi:hypothetical protein